MSVGEEVSEPLTDELLAAYERDIDTDVGILGEGRDQFRLRRLIQEVRRLREFYRTVQGASDDEIAWSETQQRRAEKAERTLSKHHPSGGQSCDQCAE